MKVSDVMQKEVDQVSTDTLVSHVSSLIFGRRINGVPVVKNKKVVGFITERDILSKFYPSFEEYINDPIHSADFEGMEKKISDIFSLPAREIMSENPVVVNYETPLLKALSLMFTHKVGRLPVVNGNKALVGIISKGDIFQALVGNKLPISEREENDIWFLRHSKLFVNWRTRLDVEIPEIVKTFNKNNVKTILDIGCGIGEHSIALAQKGFKVYAIDREQLLIEEANRKRAKLAKTVRERVNFYYGEYKDVLPKISDEFQAAIFMGNSLSYNPDKVSEVLKMTKNKLSEKAVIIFQLVNIEKILKDNNRYKNLVFVKDDPDHEHALLEFYDPSKDRGNTVRKTVAIFEFNRKSWRCFGVKNVLMAYITRKKIQTLLENAGYKHISFYGSVYRPQKWDKLFKKHFEVSKDDWLNVLATE